MSSQTEAFQILPGRVGNLTPGQQECLDKFKGSLKEQNLLCERHDDNYLLRFLRARKFDLKAATDMIFSNENWRLTKKVDQIFSDFKFDEYEEVHKLYPRYYHGTDLQGRPVYVEVLSNLDLDILFKVTTRERLEMFFIQEYERLMRIRLPAASKKLGRTVETSLTILDMKNCSVMQAMKIKDIVKLIIDIGQNYYPETMGMTFIINAPWIFDAVWNLIKGWLDEVTVNKIKIFKTSKDYTSTLFQYVDPSVVPFNLGGACQCPGGCQNSNVGPWKDAGH
jgi:hypothetical protein